MSLTSRLARLGPSQTPQERARSADSDWYGSLSTSKTHVPDPVWPAADERLCPSCDVVSAGAWCHRCGDDLSDMPRRAVSTPAPGVAAPRLSCDGSASAGRGSFVVVPGDRTDRAAPPPSSSSRVARGRRPETGSNGV